MLHYTDHYTDTDPRVTEVDVPRGAASTGTGSAALPALSRAFSFSTSNFVFPSCPFPRQQHSTISPTITAHHVVETEPRPDRR